MGKPKSPKEAKDTDEEPGPAHYKPTPLYRIPSVVIKENSDSKKRNEQHVEVGP
jgi:hypothetical protein